MPPSSVSMLALAFSFSLFAYWTLVGRAVLAAIYPRAGVLRAWLLAPAIGLSILLLGLMVFNQAGWPIRSFATYLTIGLGILGLGIWWWRRPVGSWGAVIVFFCPSLFALLWAGWPAIDTGFNWISYANDDMANYCLAAQRFADHGFYDVPTLADLGGRDYPSYYFFMHVADMMRFGAEHLVAWGACIGGLKATEAFMPVILALSLTQITSAGALVLHVGRWRKRALVTMWLLAMSPLFMLGTLYQLIAQVGGVALLLATVALLTRPWASFRRKSLLQYALLPALGSSALCIFYPEVTPFVALTAVAYAAAWGVRNRRFPHILVALAAYTLVGVVVILRHNIISYVSILVVQFAGAMDASNLLLSLFPYFMLPTGFSNLFGWMPLARDFPEPVLSVSIAAGMILMAMILARSFREAWRLFPGALLLLIQFAFAVRLFLGANDFGLYKLAMWMQPMLAAGLAGWLLTLSSRRWQIPMLVGVYALTAAPTAFYYTNTSRGTIAGSFTELRFGSQLGLEMQRPAERDAQLTSTIENVVAAKFAATELRGSPLALISRDFFWPTTRTDFKNPTLPVRSHPHFEEMAQAAPLITVRNRDMVTTGMLWRTEFSQPVIERPTDYYVSVVPRLSLFNKFYSHETGSDGVFVVQPADEVRNFLVFVHSGLGNHYYLGDRRRIAFFQQEKDYFAPDQEFNGIGRFILMRVENPPDQVYLRISATRTLMTGRTRWNPAAVVHGATDLPVDAVGHGAFNLFIGPIAPQVFEGAHYLAIDFTEFPQQVKDYRTGLKRLYNQKVPLDYRRLLGWARDISAISPGEYNALQRPREISRFPHDLATASTLEFSGAYEDGWLSPQSKFVLAAPETASFVRLRGVVPQIPGTALGSGNLKVSINGSETWELPAAPGAFDWLLPVADRDRPTKVDLTFTAFAPLPGRDQRPAAAIMEFLGLVEAQTNSDFQFSQPGTMRLASPGIDQDGWMAKSAALILPPSEKPQQLVVHYEYPDWSGAPSGTLHARLGDTRVGAEARLNPGEYSSFSMPLPSADKARTITLEASSDFALPSPDQRRRALRVLRVELSSAPNS